MAGLEIPDGETGKFVLEEPENDALDRARHCFKKGRLEFMGGPVYFEQGHNTTQDVFNPDTLQVEKVPLDNNNRVRRHAYPMAAGTDPVVMDLGVDVTEQ